MPTRHFPEVWICFLVQSPGSEQEEQMVDLYAFERDNMD